MYKQLIEKKLLDYLIKKEYPHKKSGKVVMVQCACCEREPFSASFIPNVDIVHCIPCNKDMNIIDFVRATETCFDDADDEAIYTHLRQLFNLEVPTEQEESTNDILFDIFEKNEFCFVQLSKNCHDKKWSYGKTPWEKEWTAHENKDIYTCKEWIKSGLNIGVRTGAVSGITVIDIDAMPVGIKERVYEGKATGASIKRAIRIREKILKETLIKLNVKLGETLYQETFGGVQLFYKYDKDLPKTRINAISTDIETDGGQVVVEPSLVGGTNRKFIISPIVELPKALKEYLLKGLEDQRNNTAPKVMGEANSKNREAITGGLSDQEFEKKNLNFGLVSKGDGRSNFLIKMGGAIRPFFNIVATKRIIHILNRTLLNPPIPEVGVEQTVLKSIEKYARADDHELANAVLEYLKKVKTARKDEIEVRILGHRAKGEDKERIDGALIYLITTDKITKKRTEYSIIEDMVWTDTLVNHMKPITAFKYPYFDSHCHFCWGDLLILGSQNKFGKTVLAMNFLKRFVNQGIKPYYIYNESGSRFVKACWKLGLKDGDFFKVRCTDPEKIILPKNAVCIYDWVKPNKDDGFARLDLLFERIVDKLEKTDSIMLCFVQLRGNNEFFAKDQIGQHPALLAKYVYEDEKGILTKFQLINVRDGKLKGKQFEIPCKYNWETKEVKTIEEIGRGDNERN